MTRAFHHIASFVVAPPRGCHISLKPTSQNKTKTKSPTGKTDDGQVRVLRGLRHPNVVDVLLFFRSDPTFYFVVFERIRGGELFDRFREKVSVSSRKTTGSERGFCVSSRGVIQNKRLETWVDRCLGGSGDNFHDHLLLFLVDSSQVLLIATYVGIVFRQPTNSNRKATMRMRCATPAAFS